MEIVKESITISHLCLVTSLHLVQAGMVKICPKKDNKKKYLIYRPFHKTLPRTSVFVYWISVRFYETDCTLNKGQLSTLLMLCNFTFPLKFCTQSVLFTICTLYYLKKLKRLLNIVTEYKIFLIKSFLITYQLFVTYI